ncbi:BTAD domain-containing putative transcriptional regulator [Actinophytocola sp. NPDC049390]|uniref:AfsR/SARP family transcriptional regulator n=1 Tax=Actinophytocola sp. NPDC049390 TaxID=3363894 RepID=UPI0037BB78C9
MAQGDRTIYRLLGPLEVGHEGEQAIVRPGRQEIVLCVLLLNANRVVSIDRLIDAVWDTDPPATARTQVQICVSALRANLGRIGLPASIVTKPPGYLMRVADGELDAQVFGAHVAGADDAVRAGDPAEAAGLLAAALALWRGPALAGLRSPVLRSIAVQFDERRLSATETRFDLELRLGRHRQLVDELSELVDANPLRERLRALLMLALYRSGRQADALDVYRTGRALLIDQLGLEPGDELRALEATILAGGADPAPDGRGPARTPEVSSLSQLPADTEDITGRDDLIAEIERVLRAGTRVVVLTGKPGVGKSTLAVHVAHLLRAAFPDGQLYRDLGGARSTPASPLEALGRFLRAVGVPGEAVPDDLDERAELYRQVLATRRTLVVLDDVADEGQLRPLLPGTGDSAVLVTSRARLAGLPGALRFDVDVLGAEHALELLAKVVGEERITAEPDAAHALFRLVGGLPLAMRIVAARLAARPHWSLAWMLERLSDERRRLDELTHGDLMVRASLAMTYDGLDPEARRLLRLLSVFDGASFPGWFAAAVLDIDYYAAFDLLELLVDAQMLEIAGLDPGGGPRYKFHNLIRLFARERLDAEESDADWLAAVTRVTGGWLAIVDEAHRRIYGGDFTVLHGDAPRLPPPRSYVDGVLADDPFRWLDAEHANLCAAVELAATSGLAEACWDLACTLVTAFEARCLFDDWARTHEQALAAVRAAGLRRGEAALLCSLGSLHLSRARPYEVAEEYLLPALTTFTALGDRHGAALALRDLGLLDRGYQDGDRAGGLFSRALDGFQEVGDLIGQAHVLGELAKIDIDTGLIERAEQRLTVAVRIAGSAANHRVTTQLRFRMSELMISQGRYTEARAVLTELVGKVRAAGDIAGESRIQHRLGRVHAKLGELDAAEQAMLTAAALRERAMEHSGRAEILLELAGVLAEHGRSARAAELLTTAMVSFTDHDLTDPLRRATTLLAGLGV